MSTPLTVRDLNLNSIRDALWQVIGEEATETLLDHAALTGDALSCTLDDFKRWVAEDKVDLLPPEIEAAYHLAMAWYALSDFRP